MSQAAKLVRKPARGRSENAWRGSCKTEEKPHGNTQRKSRDDGLDIPAALKRGGARPGCEEPAAMLAAVQAKLAQGKPHRSTWTSWRRRSATSSSASHARTRGCDLRRTSDRLAGPRVQSRRPACGCAVGNDIVRGGTAAARVRAPADRDAGAWPGASSALPHRVIALLKSVQLCVLPSGRKRR